VQLIRQARELQTGGRKVCIAIGMFDGVHLGHQQVIKQTIFDARQHNALSVAVTFDKHPNAIVAPQRVPPLIYSLPQKLREMEAIGIDAILLLEFTPEFSQQPGEQFVRALAGDLAQIYSICVGNNFTFGHKRGGNVDLLKKLGVQIGFQVHGLAAVSLAGQIVSSTRIREHISRGDLDATSQMLGRSYAISGIVHSGDQIGRTLGFPTANVDVRGLVTPPAGVYAAVAKTGKGTFPAAVNIGTRPTLARNDSDRRVEAHLLDFNGDLYNTEVELCFTQSIRAEQRFANLEELKLQIARDIEAVRRLSD
jgi:riboflavin kinase / FMN adenylyltransferase